LEKIKLKRLIIDLSSPGTLVTLGTPGTLVTLVTKTFIDNEF